MVKSIDAAQVKDLGPRIKTRAAKKYFYQKSYQKYLEVLSRCPPKGLIVELGSGFGFAKEYIKDLITTDIVSYSGLDCVTDGKLLPFEDKSVRLFCMLNVFHHVSDVNTLLSEMNRCLVDKGRVILIDQHNGIISRLILKNLHHEHFDDKTYEWKFTSDNPLIDANGALAWIVFQRDLAGFEKKFPELKLIQYKSHTPLYYWLSGGLKWWSLIPRSLIPAVNLLDKSLMRISTDLGSFVDIELLKVNITNN